MTLDTTGCYVNSPAAIETFTGRFVNVLEIEPESIAIADIAHSLSLQCRFNGHCARFESVAEHSCYVHDYVLECITGSTKVRLYALAALLHDASESYLCDIPRPLKPQLAEYAEIEHKVQAAIFERYGVSISDEQYVRIKSADNAVLKAEAQQLMATCGEQWGFGDVRAANIKIRCWSPTKAKRQFLKRFLRWQ